MIEVFPFLLSYLGKAVLISLFLGFFAASIRMYLVHTGHPGASNSWWNPITYLPMIAIATIAGALLISVVGSWLGPDAGVYFEDPAAVLRGTLGALVVAATASMLFILKLTHLRSFAVLKLVFSFVVAYQTIVAMGNQVRPLEVAAMVAAALGMLSGMDDLKKDSDARRDASPT